MPHIQQRSVVSIRVRNLLKKMLQPLKTSFSYWDASKTRENWKRKKIFQKETSHMHASSFYDLNFVVSLIIFRRFFSFRPSFLSSSVRSFFIFLLLPEATSSLKVCLCKPQSCMWEESVEETSFGISSRSSRAFGTRWHKSLEENTFM